ncbi:hypothetical protein SEA_JACKO_10 [Microbacterium phage Jacko]|nr:hypothetical protein SEA_JACKO_10 [Microbacterium phage Jacko]
MNPKYISMNPKYIVMSDGGGNPKVLVKGQDGTYATLTHGAGEKSLADLIEMIALANAQAEREAAQ